MTVFHSNPGTRARTLNLAAKFRGYGMLGAVPAEGFSDMTDTVLAFPYTVRGACNERAGFERYLQAKAALNERPGVSSGFLRAVGLCILVMGAIYALIVWGIWL